MIGAVSKPPPGPDLYLVLCSLGAMLMAQRENLSKISTKADYLVAIKGIWVFIIPMGCALPTVPAYCIVALVVALVLVNMGVDRLLAHFFVFYYAVLAVITPPVAPGSIVASKMAEANFMRTAWEATKLAAPFFLVPYFFIYNPMLVLEPQKDLGGIILAAGGMLIGCGSLMIALQKWFLVKTTGAERLMLFISAVLATTYSSNQSHLLLLVAAMIFGGVLLLQIHKLRLSQLGATKVL